MTGRHAAPPDEAFDHQERDHAGTHRADVEVPLGPDDVPAPVSEASPKPARRRATAKKAGT
jgi:hypothetical protein